MASAPGWSGSAQPRTRTGSAPALTPAQFGRQFHDSFRTFWLVALGITHDPTLAEDVVQDAAVVALGKLDQFDPGTNFNAWMSQMVRFVGYNMTRRENKRRAASTDPVELDRGIGAAQAALPAWPGGASTEIGRDQQWFDDSLVAALKSVSPAARACLLLRTLGGFDYAEISKLLDIPEGTAMSHVHRTRKYLRERMGPSLGSGSKPQGSA